MVRVQLLALPEGLPRMWGLLKCQFLYEELGLAVFHVAFPVMVVAF